MARSTAIRDRQRARLRASGAACHWCGKPIDYTLTHPHPWSLEADHVIPLARGGADDTNNIVATHLKCNRRKGTALHSNIIRRSASLR